MYYAYHFERVTLFLYKHMHTEYSNEIFSSFCLFSRLFIIVYVCMFCLHALLWTTCMCFCAPSQCLLPEEAQRGYKILWNWSY